MLRVQISNNPMTAAYDFSSYSRQELIDLCRQKQVAGHSKKKIHELIELLVKAGVHPEKLGAAKPAASPSSASLAKPDVPTPEQPTQPSSSLGASPSASPSQQQRQYIFNAAWPQVLPYLEDASIALIIADAPSNALGDKWLVEGLRLLETGGAFLIRGLPRVPPCVPKTIHTTWYTLQDKTKVLVLQKEAAATNDTTAAAATDLYIRFLNTIAEGATVLMPFAGDGDAAKLVKTCGRSLIAMDRDESRVQKLYDLTT